MTARAGIQEYGKEAEDALIADFAQFNDMSVFEPVQEANRLLGQQHAIALRAINLINKKQEECLKGQTMVETVYNANYMTSPR